jgi:hypothetical protein
MNKQTKVAAGETDPLADPAVEIPQDIPSEAPVATEAPTPSAVQAVPGTEQAAPKGGSFANFEEMKQRIGEADAAIKQNPELAAKMYTVDTSTNPLSFTLTINNKQKVAPASLQRPTKKASRILEANFPAEWLKSMGF